MVDRSSAVYLERFADERIVCNQYALAKLGINTTHCILKVDEYMLLCAPYILGFKQAELIASLSKQELVFFQRYRNSIVGLSLEFNAQRKSGALKVFVRAILNKLVTMPKRENVGIFTIDYRAAPGNLVEILGDFLDHQQQLISLHQLYHRDSIFISPDSAKRLGYNQYATIVDETGSRRFQLYSLSTSTIDLLEANTAPIRKAGHEVAIQLFFRKYRVKVPGKILKASRLPNGIVKSQCQLNFNPELTEIIDEYWVANRK